MRFQRTKAFLRIAASFLIAWVLLIVGANMVVDSFAPRFHTLLVRRIVGIQVPYPSVEHLERYQDERAGRTGPLYTGEFDRPIVFGTLLLLAIVAALLVFWREKNRLRPAKPPVRSLVE